MSTTALIIPFVLTVAGVALIRGVWRRSMAYRSVLLWAGWAVIGLSSYFWVRGFGVEFGLVFALGVVSLVAWFVTGLNIELKQGHTSRGPRDLPRLPGIGVFGKQFIVFLLVTIFALVVSLLVTIGMSRAFTLTEIDRMAFVIVALPILWGVLAYQLCFSSRIVRSFAWLVLAGLGGVGMMMV